MRNKTLYSYGFISELNEDNLKIMELIEKKRPSHKRNDFNSYQACYSDEEKCVKRSELVLLKFSF